MTALEVTRPARSETKAARSERFRLLVRSPTVIIGGVVVLFWVFCAVFPSLVAPHDPIFDNQFPTSLKPTWSYPFGTDTNGRDIFSRVLAGSRNVLLIAPAATLISEWSNESKADGSPSTLIFPRKVVSRMLAERDHSLG